MLGARRKRRGEGWNGWYEDGVAICGVCFWNGVAVNGRGFLDSVKEQIE